MSDGKRKHSRKLIGAAFLLLLLLAWLALRGESPGASVSGKVAAKDGRPVTWGTVTVIASDNKPYSAPIRPDGTYRIDGLPPGPVRAAVTSPDPRRYLGSTPDTPKTSTGSKTDRGVKSRSVTVQVGGSGGGAGNGSGSGSTVGGFGSRGTNGGNRTAGAKQVYGADATITPPKVTAPPNLPPAGQWFPIPGRFADPSTSGLTGQVGPSVTVFDLTVE